MGYKSISASIRNEFARGNCLINGIESFWSYANRSVAIFRAPRKGVRPISGANNGAPAIAFGGPRSSCVRPGAHSARHQDSRNDLTPCRMAWHFVSDGAHAPHSDQTLGPTPTRGVHSARRLRSLPSLCSSTEACKIQGRSQTYVSSLPQRM